MTLKNKKIKQLRDRLDDIELMLSISAAGFETVKTEKELLLEWDVVNTLIDEAVNEEIYRNW